MVLKVGAAKAVDTYWKKVNGHLCRDKDSNKTFVYADHCCLFISLQSCYLGDRKDIWPVKEMFPLSQKTPPVITPEVKAVKQQKIKSCNTQLLFANGQIVISYHHTQWTAEGSVFCAIRLVFVCVWNLGNCWMNLCQIQMEDVIVPWLGRVWGQGQRSRLLWTKNCTFSPFWWPACILCLVKHL